MASKTLLDDLELPLAQCIDVEDQRALVRHAVPGLDGDLLQEMGRRAARVAVTGVVAGTEAREGLEALRVRLRGAQPVDFVADVATATRVTRVLVEKLDVRELAGRPERFEYAFLLREYVPPPPRQTEVPPVVPPGPSTETGILEVEVVVEGEPDFDMARVTVTAQGAGPAGPTTRTLAERAGTVWTEAAAPPGAHAVRAAVAEPEMTGAAEATVRAGQTTRVRITLVPAQGVARAFSVSFRFDSAFVEPCMRAALRRAASYGRAHPSQKLLVVGHTDKTGSDAYNQSLSERRARAVFACVSFQEAPGAAVAEWTALRQARTGDPVRTLTDRWGTREYQQMLQQLGDYPGQIDAIHGPITSEAVRAFRCRKGLPPGTTVDDAVWAALIHDYLADDPPAVPRAQLLPNCDATKLEWLGCGEQDPVDNTAAAHRPNRRVELLFTTAAALPARVPVPDTWTLPPPGRTAAEWCAGPGDPAKRCAFSVRTPPPQPPKLLIQPAEPGQVEARGRILREVERPDGTVEQLPAANESFVLITAAGEFRAGEAGSGLPTPARTGADGSFSFPGKPRGLYALEVQRGVLARLLDAPGAAALGPTVCKALAADGARLDVLILRDPVLREIRLPVVVHLMAALHPTTRAVRTCLDESTSTPTTHPQRTARDEAAVRALLTGANAIWGRARVRFEVRDVVREAFATVGRSECHVTDAERNRVVADSATPNAVNLYFFGSVDVLNEGGVTLRGGLVDGAGTQVRELLAIGIADVVQRQVLPPIPPSRHTPGAREAEVILAHELGHWLSLEHEEGVDSAPQNRNRLMLPDVGAEHRRLLDAEVTQARGSSDAARECVPLALRVAGAVRYGGAHGHRFIALRDPAAPPVTVDAVLPPHLPSSGLSLTGGAAGAGPTQRLVPRGPVLGRTEVIARYAQAGGRPLETYAAVHVATFDLAVEGATRTGGPAGTTFVAVRSATGRVTVRADVFPAPDVVPFDLAAWSAGDETDDPLRRTLPLATAGSTALSVTAAGVTRTITVVVAELTLNVTGAERTGPDQFAAVQHDTEDVTVEAVFTPPVPDDVGLVSWEGGEEGPGPRFRVVSREGVGVTTVAARVGAAPAAPAPGVSQATGGGTPDAGVKSATITVFDFALDVPGATRLDGPTGTRFVAPPNAADLAVVASITPPGILPGVVTWTGAQEIPGMTPPQALVRRSARRTVTVTATIGVDTRSIEIFIVSFRLDVPGATRLATPGGNDFLVLVDPAANVEVNAVLDPPVPSPPADLVAWTSSDNSAVAGAGPLQRLVPRTPRRSLTVTGTVAGQVETVQVFVSEFTLAVTGAGEIPPSGSTEFIALEAAGQFATVTATVDPAPTPIPAGLIAWGGDPTAADGPAARRVALDTARPGVRVEATVAGVTRAVRVNVVTFALVVPGATAVPAGGSTFFIARQAGATVTVEARITPPPAVPLPPDFIVWTGSTPETGDSLRSTVDRGTPGVTPVQAASALLGGATRSVTVHVFTFTLAVRAPAVAIGPAGDGHFLALQSLDRLTAEVVIAPAANPLPAGLVAWSGAAPVAGNELLATVSRAVPGPPAEVRATVLGIAQTVTVHVATFELEVDDATPVPDPGTDFFALRGAGHVTVRAVLTPVPPVSLPADLVGWTGGTAVPGNPLAHRVTRATSGTTPVQAQALGATRTRVIHVVGMRLEVQNASRLGPEGSGRFGTAVDPALTATVTAVLEHAPTPLPADFVAWSGTPVTATGPLQRTVPRNLGHAFTVTATVLGVPHTVVVEVMAFSVRADPGVLSTATPTDAFVLVHPTAPFAVQALLVPPPSLPVPDGFVAWSAGTPLPANPLRTLLPRAGVGVVDVTGTIHGVARALHVTLVQIEAVATATNAAPPLTFTRFGLWDQAYDAAGEIRHAVAEADNFVGRDKRRFHFRVRDPSRADPTLAVDWKTLNAARADDDAPASKLLTLPQAAPGVYISRAVMLVTNDTDLNVPTDSGLVGIAGETGARSRGGSNYRLRRAAMDGFIRCEYTPAPGATLALELPVFSRTPDERRRLGVRVVRYTSAVAGYQAETAADIAAQFAHANLRWNQIGIEIDPQPTQDRVVPAGALNGVGRFPFAHPDGAQEVAVLRDLLPLTPDNTLTVVFIDLVGPNAYAAILPVAPIPVPLPPGPPPAVLPPPLTMGDRFFVFMGTRMPLTDETLAHELHHVLFNRGDVPSARRFFTLNTTPPSLFASLAGIALPDSRIYHRIQDLHSPDPDNDPANDNVINWARRARAGRHPVEGGAGAATATTGNTLLTAF
jgi:outer membrane protein OmpA-like peptidoglycan-associated protein